jgi:hypothetical protein
MSTRFKANYYTSLPTLQLPPTHRTWCDQAIHLSEIEYFSTVAWFAIDFERKQHSKRQVNR